MEKSTLIPALPPASYVSNEFFLAEKENIFKKEWTFLCHAQQIPELGDYLTLDVMGIPLIALRDFEGQIQILLNVCRHRGAPLLTEKSGRLEKPLLMCSYHGWCYRTDGTFKQAPFLNHTESLDLKKINYSDINGMLFVSFNDHPYPFSDRKNQVMQEMQQAQFKVEEYHYHSQITRRGAFNWKVWVEGFQECYHCPTIHPLFNKDFHLSKYTVENKDHFSVHQCPRKNNQSSGNFEGLWLWLYPNCGLPCYEKVYYSMRINPKSAGETELVYTFFMRPEMTIEEQSTFFAFVEQVTDEDIVICERVQKNLENASGDSLFEGGVLNEARENGVQYFHQLVQKALNMPMSQAREISLPNSAMQPTNSLLC